MTNNQSECRTDATIWSRKPFAGLPKRRWALGLLTVLGVGCPGIPRPLEKPAVTLQSVAVTDVSLVGLDVRASFAMANPNSIGVPLSALDWELSIGGAAPVRGRATLSETIPAKGTAPIDIDLHLSAGAAVDTAAAIARGATGFRFAGTLHFQTRLGDIAVAFDETGSLSDLPRNQTGASNPSTPPAPTSHGRGSLALLSPPALLLPRPLALLPFRAL